MAIKAITKAAKNLKKIIYLSVTVIAINTANKAILQKNINRKAIFTLTPNRPRRLWRCWQYLQNSCFFTILTLIFL